MLRNDKPQLDIRLLSGTLVRSWPIAPSAAPLLDADVARNLAVYTAGAAVHEPHLDPGTHPVAGPAPGRTRPHSAPTRPPLSPPARSVRTSIVPRVPSLPTF